MRHIRRSGLTLFKFRHTDGNLTTGRAAEQYVGVCGAKTALGLESDAVTCASPACRPLMITVYSETGVIEHAIKVISRTCIYNAVRVITIPDKCIKCLRCKVVERQSVPRRCLYAPIDILLEINNG